MPKKILFNFVVDDKGCYNCISHTHKRPRAYPMVSYNGKPQSLARHIYRECFGEIPAGMVLRHKCDNYSCINPEHLDIGTNQQNRQDMVDRGRSFRPYGEANGMTLLTENNVIEIKKLKGTATQQAIADRFGVARETIKDIWNGRRWGHVSVGG